MVKKQYTSPSVKAYSMRTATILAGSEQTVQGGGSNKDTGIKTAEGKGNYFNGWE